MQTETIWLHCMIRRELPACIAGNDMSTAPTLQAAWHASRLAAACMHREDVCNIRGMRRGESQVRNKGGVALVVLNARHLVLHPLVQQRLHLRAHPKQANPSVITHHAPSPACRKLTEWKLAALNNPLIDPPVVLDNGVYHSKAFTCPSDCPPRKYSTCTCAGSGR